MPGVWSLEGSGSLPLSDVSAKVEAVPGGLMPQVKRVLTLPALGDGSIYARARVEPRLVTLQLQSQRRGVKDGALRSALLPYCRPEAGLIAIQYVGLNGTLQLSMYYLDGLDDLAPRFIAPDPRWVGALSAGSALPGTAMSIGTAATEPTITIVASSAVTVTQIALENAGFTDLAFRLNLSLSLAAGQSAVFIIAARTATRYTGGASLLSVIQPGSDFANFLIYPGANVLTITKTGTLTATLQYNERYWSWEDIDQ